MNISKIIRRNLELEVSGKHANKDVSVKLGFVSCGLGYYVVLSSRLHVKGCVTKECRQQIAFEVRARDDYDTVSIGEFLIETLYQFKRIADYEQKEFDINRLMTVFVKEQFSYNSDVADELDSNVQIVCPEYTGEKVNNEFNEKAEVDGRIYEFVYQPFCMGFKGKAKVDGIEISFELL